MSGLTSALDDLSFAVVIECREGLIPSASQPEVRKIYGLRARRLRITNQDLQSEPAPWAPASKSHTTSSVSEKAQLHAVKAVETGVINVGVL